MFLFRKPVGVNQSWLDGFEARSSSERVKNCTKLPPDFIEHMIVKVLAAILDKATAEDRIALTDGRVWNKGGCNQIFFKHFYYLLI